MSYDNDCVYLECMPGAEAQETVCNADVLAVDRKTNSYVRIDGQSAALNNVLSVISVDGTTICMGWAPGATTLSSLIDVEVDGVLNNQTIIYVDGTWIATALPGFDGSVGQANIATNVGLGEGQFVAPKTGLTLPFRTLTSPTDTLVISTDLIGNTVDVDINIFNVAGSGDLLTRDGFGNNVVVPSPVGPNDVLYNNGGTLKYTGAGVDKAVLTIDGTTPLWSTRIEAVASSGVGDESLLLSAVHSDGTAVVKTLSAGAGIDLTSDANTVTISADLSALSLAELADVTFAALAAGQELVYDGTNWVNQDALTVQSSVTGDVQLFDGTGASSGVETFKRLTAGDNITLTADVNQITVDVDLASINIGDLNDVDVTGVTVNDILVYDGTQWSVDQAINSLQDNDTIGVVGQLTPQTGPLTLRAFVSADDTIALTIDGSANINLAANVELSNLTDVDAALSPASGQVLTYDGTEWTAAAPSGGGGGSLLHYEPGVYLEGTDNTFITVIADGTGITGVDDESGIITITIPLGVQLHRFDIRGNNSTLDGGGDVIIRVVDPNGPLNAPAPYNTTANNVIKPDVTLYNSVTGSALAFPGLSGSEFRIGDSGAPFGGINAITGQVSYFANPSPFASGWILSFSYLS